MTLERILSELRYRSGIGQAVRRKIRRDGHLIEEIARTAYQGENFQFALCGHTPLTRLAAVTYLLPRKYDGYKGRGIPDGVIFDTFRDVSARSALYFDRTGKAGISKDDVIWFRHIMNANIFQIGALQFQPFEMIYLDEETTGEPYMRFSAEQKKALPSGAPVLNCHIPRGADLSAQSVEASFQDAAAFFAEYFPTVPYRAFLCYSWLLYPPMLKRLPEKSNIKKFAARFSVIGCCDDAEQAMEALFEPGMRADKKLPVHPTSLQRLAVEQAEQFGFACGIIAL